MGWFVVRKRKKKRVQQEFRPCLVSHQEIRERSKETGRESHVLSYWSMQVRLKSYYNNLFVTTLIIPVYLT